MLSRKLKIGCLCSVPTGVFSRTFKTDDLTKAGLVYETFLLTLPKEVFVFFCKGAKIHVFIWVEVDQVIGVVLYCFSVSEEAWPKCRPVRVEDLFLWYVSTRLAGVYSNTQSSYCSISFMQGVVSKVGGTDAGTLPKYKNDIKQYQLKANKIKGQIWSRVERESFGSRVINQNRVQKDIFESGSIQISRSQGMITEEIFTRQLRQSIQQPESPMHNDISLDFFGLPSLESFAIKDQNFIAERLISLLIEFENQVF